MDASDRSNSGLRDSISLQVPAAAYVRQVATEKGLGYAVCDAAGNRLALFDTQEAAYFAALQHDLKPSLLH